MNGQISKHFKNSTPHDPYKTEQKAADIIASKNRPDAVSVIKLSKGDCYMSIDQVEICYNELLEDSRCPPRVQCIWAGNAKLKVELKFRDGVQHEFKPNTNYRYFKDTTINNTYILFEGLSRKGKSPSIAEFLMVDLDECESNAQLVGFNTTRGCSYGYQIKIGNDTIISNDHKIEEEFQDKIDFPQAVYLEQGPEKIECKKEEGFKNYYLSRIVKTIGKMD